MGQPRCSDSNPPCYVWKCWAASLRAGNMHSHCVCLQSRRSWWWPLLLKSFPIIIPIHFPMSQKIQHSWFPETKRKGFVVVTNFFVSSKERMVIVGVLGKDGREIKQIHNKFREKERNWKNKSKGTGRKERSGVDRIMLIQHCVPGAKSKFWCSYWIPEVKGWALGFVSLPSQEP